MYTGYVNQTYYQETDERQSKKARTDWDALGSTGYDGQTYYQDTVERQSKKDWTDWDALGATGYDDQTYNQDTDGRQSKTARTDWDALAGPGYDDQTYYQDTGDRQSKTARTDWDEPSPSTQNTHEYEDSGYTSTSTRYPEYLSELVKDINNADNSNHSYGKQDSRSTYNLTNCQGFSPMKNIPNSSCSSNLQDNFSGVKTSFSSSTGHRGISASGRSGNKGSSASSRVNTFSQGLDSTNWYDRESVFRSGSALGQTKNYEGSSYCNLMTLDDGPSEQNQTFSSHSATGFETGIRSGSDMGQVLNYGGSNYDDEFTQRNEDSSSFSAASVIPDFDQTDNSTFEKDPNTSQKNQSVQLYRPADLQGSFTFEDRYEEEEDSMIEIDYSSQYGMFKEITSVKVEPARTIGTSPNQVQQGNSKQNHSSNWASQRINQESSQHGMSEERTSVNFEPALTMDRSQKRGQQGNSTKNRSSTRESQRTNHESSQHGMFEERTSVNLEAARTFDTSQERSQQGKSGHKQSSNWDRSQKRGQQGNSTKNRSSTREGQRTNHESSQHGMFEERTSVNLEAARTFDTSQERSQQGNSGHKQSSNWESQRINRESSRHGIFEERSSVNYEAARTMDTSQKLGQQGNSKQNHSSTRESQRINLESSHLGMFDERTSVNFEPGRTFDTSQNQGQQGNSNQNCCSNWESQRINQVRDCDDTHHHSHSSKRRSLRREGTLQDNRSGSAQGKDEYDDLTLRMAGKIQQTQQGKVDVKKNLKIMNIVDQMSENEEANITQGCVGAGNRRITDKPRFGVSQDFLSMRGSSGRQERSSSQGGRMNMMKQRVGMGLTGQGPRTGMVKQRASTGKMGQDSDMGMTEQDTSKGIMERDVYKEMIGQGSMIGEDGGVDMMGLGSEWNMAEQIVGMGMSGRESRNRTTFSDETFVGNHEERGQIQHRVPFVKKDFAYPPKQEKEPPRSLLDMYIPVPDKMKKYTMAQSKTESQSQGPLVQPHKMSLYKKFCQFLKFLKTEDLKRNSINVIDNAINRSHLDLQKDFKFEPFLTAEKKEMVSGRLLINGIFLARVSGTMGRMGKGKELKNKCYEKALHLLTTQSAAVIMNQKDPNEEKVISGRTEELKENMTENKEVLDAEKHEFRKRLETLKQHTRSIKTDDDGDYVAVLIDAMTQFGLDYSYSDEKTKSACVIPWFVGKLKIGDIHVGVGSGPSKKYAKRRTFSRALHFLKTKDLSKSMEGFAVQEKDLIPELEVLCEAALPNRDTEGKLAKMIILVLEIPEGKPIQVRFQEFAGQLELRISLLYKSGHRVQHGLTTQCNLFLDNIFISSGEASKRAEAESLAYQEALTVLCSSSADVIFNDFKRMSGEDSKGVIELSELWANGGRKHMFFGNESKVAELKARFNFLNPKGEQSSEDIIDKDEIIIMENKRFSGDRYMNAYNILQTSAAMNLMLLQSRISVYCGNHCCNLYLQHMKVGQGYMQQREDATTLAAARALFKLYQTQPTIGIADIEIQNAFSFETMKNRADALKEECGDTGDDDYIYITSDVGSKWKSEDEDEDVEQHDEAPTSTLPVNKWLKQVIEEMIKQFASEETLEELIFCGEFPAGDRLQIQLTAEKYYVETRMCYRNGLEYIVAYQKYLPPKILEILRNNDGHSGLYSIILKYELPKPSDIVSNQKPSRNRNTIPQSERKLSYSTEAQYFHSGFRRKRRHQQMSQW